MDIYVSDRCLVGTGVVRVAKSNEPVWWSLFSAGGMVSAMIFPVLMVITGIIVPFGLAGDEPLSFAAVYSCVSNTFIKLILFGVIVLPLFHWAHRFRFTLVDIGLKSLSTIISIVCYGSAIAGTVITVVILWGV